MSIAFFLSIKAVVRNALGECLILRRSGYSRHHEGKWDFPGGRAAPGENFDRALMREIKEETNLDVTIERAVGWAEARTETKAIVYLLMEATAISQEIRLSEEHTEYRWVAPAELPVAEMCDQFQPFCAGYGNSPDIF